MEREIPGLYETWVKFEDAKLLDRVLGRLLFSEVVGGVRAGTAEKN